MRATTNLWPNIWPKQWTNAWTNAWTQNVFFFFSHIYHVWTNMFKKKKITKPVDPIIDYVEKQQAMLMRCADKTLLNQNIDPVFYSKKDFQFMLIDSKNRHETLWKTRILVAATPRGNIIMYYDVYKLGFAYYSDTQSIPYSILNATAMKYVRQFHCLDFFMDDRVFPEFHTSPLISILLAEEKKNVENKDEKSKNSVPKQGPFAKLKTYSKKTGEESETKTTEGAVEAPPKIYTTNRFICLGKIYNFKLLQQTPDFKKVIVKEYTSKIFDNFRPIHPAEDTRSEPPSKKTEVNYSAFKELRNRKVLLETSTVA